MDLNRVMLIGTVVTDPEMRFTPNGAAVTTFRLVAGRNYSAPDGERREEREFFSVVVWNKLAETCSQYLQKGRRAFVEGRLQTRSWEGQDGQRRYRTEVVAQQVLFLDRPSAGAAPAEAQQEGETDSSDEDFPFES